MAYLARNYEVLSLQETAKKLAGGDSLRGCVAITFDDGFRDNYLNAYPILRKYNLPATIFLTTGSIESGQSPWFIRLRHLFMKTAKTDCVLSTNEGSRSCSMYTKESKYSASEEVMDLLKNLADKERDEYLAKLALQLGVTEFHDLNDLMLTWDQVKEMAGDNIDFGAHTVTHPVLANLPLSVAEEEIRQSKEAIQGVISKPVNTFAYPFGKTHHYNPSLFPILKNLKFICAVTTEKNPNRHINNPYELNRFHPWEFSIL